MARSDGKRCTCNSCKRHYIYKRSSGHTFKLCNSCSVNDRRFERKIKVVKYLGGKCSRCGYIKSLYALQAHHRDPSKKSFSISGNHTRSWESVKRELKKCILLCANCHAEEHGTRNPHTPEARK